MACVATPRVAKTSPWLLRLAPRAPRHRHAPPPSGRAQLLHLELSGRARLELGSAPRAAGTTRPRSCCRRSAPERAVGGEPGARTDRSREPARRQAPASDASSGRRRRDDGGAGVARGRARPRHCESSRLGGAIGRASARSDMKCNLREPTLPCMQPRSPRNALPASDSPLSKDPATLPRPDLAEPRTSRAEAGWRWRRSPSSPGGRVHPTSVSLEPGSRSSECLEWP